MNSNTGTTAGVCSPPFSLAEDSQTLQLEQKRGPVSTWAPPGPHVTGISGAMTAEAAVPAPPNPTPSHRDGSAAAASPIPPAHPHSCRGAAHRATPARTGAASTAGGVCLASPHRVLEESGKQSMDFLALYKDLQEQRSGLVWLRLVFICMKLCWQHSCPLFNADFVCSPLPARVEQALPH